MSFPSVSPTDFVRNAVTAAHHYGFQSVETLKADPACANCEKKVAHHSTAADRRSDNLHGLLTGGMTTYFDNKLSALTGPAFFYTTDVVPRTGETAVSLHIFNVKKSIAEAILLQTIRSFLSDLGVSDYYVRVNSLGDPESLGRYIRELTNYLKRRLEDMPPAARELMKDHPLTALMHLIEKDHDLSRRSPSPLEYLSDQSRKHFREIVEFLDVSALPYEIDTRLIGSHDCYSDTLFSYEFPATESDASHSPLYIRGGRYSNFVAKASKAKVPAVGAVLVLRDKKAPENLPTPRSTPAPSVFLAQLGFGPKIKSLLIIDELRRAGIPVYQDVVCDSISEQLRQAENRRVRYAVIVGQKEYVDGTVILRDLSAQSQEYIPVSALAARLRRATATA
jgi:histidyl-tRNA synthetase